MYNIKKKNEKKVIKITTFEDILDALKQRPEWRESMRQIILTEELLKLPAEVKGFSNKFDDFVKDEFHPLKGEFNSLKEKVNNVEKDVTVLKEDVTVLKEDVTVLKEDVAVLKEDVAVLKEDVAVLKEDVTVLKEDVAVLKEDVAVLKEDVAILKKDVELLKEDVKVLKDDMASLKGSDFERTVRERAPAYLGKLIRRCRVIPLEELAMKLEEGVDKELISEDDKSDALLVDLVVRGMLKNGKEVLLALEVSIKVEEYDVTRASRRAKVIAKAMNHETIGVAFGKEIGKDAIEEAEKLGVLLL